MGLTSSARASLRMTLALADFVRERSMLVSYRRYSSGACARSVGL